MAKVLADRDACTLGLLKWITVPSSFIIFTWEEKDTAGILITHWKVNWATTWMNETKGILCMKLVSTTSSFIWFLCFDLYETLCGNLLDQSSKNKPDDDMIGERFSLSYLPLWHDNYKRLRTLREEEEEKENSAALTLVFILILSEMPHLLYSRDVVHRQFLQWALEFFIVSCCRFVNNLFLPAGCSLRREQVWMPKKRKSLDDWMNQNVKHSLIPLCQPFFNLCGTFYFYILGII